MATKTNVLQAKNVLSELKADLREHIGDEIKIRAHRGRRKIKEKTGIVENVYDSVFTVVVENELASNRKESYTYSDIITDTVEITLLKSNTKIDIS